MTTHCQPQARQVSGFQVNQKLEYLINLNLKTMFMISSFHIKYSSLFGLDRLGTAPVTVQRKLPEARGRPGDSEAPAAAAAAGPGIMISSEST
jgi:hypothetical protein